MGRGKGLCVYYDSRHVAKKASMSPLGSLASPDHDLLKRAEWAVEIQTCKIAVV